MNEIQKPPPYTPCVSVNLLVFFQVISLFPNLLDLFQIDSSFPIDSPIDFTNKITIKPFIAKGNNLCSLKSSAGTVTITHQSFGQLYSRKRPVKESK